MTAGERIEPMTQAYTFVARLAMCGFAATLAVPSVVVAQSDYRLLATNKTSTMEKEMQEAGEAGYRFVCVMGGETSFGGNEVVVIMGKTPDATPRFEYRLLATSKTSTMQKELQEASDAGFEFKDQTVFESTFGGKEVAVIVERDREAEPGPNFEYLLLATSRTSTMQKEIREAADQGYQVVGMTVGETQFGGSELVTITRRSRP
jgi:hypothetical protein